MKVLQRVIFERLDDEPEISSDESAIGTSTETAFAELSERTIPERKIGRDDAAN